MPPITDRELRTIAYELLKSVGKISMSIDKKFDEIPKDIKQMRESIDVAMEIIERLNAKKHASQEEIIAEMDKANQKIIDNKDQPKQSSNERTKRHE